MGHHIICCYFYFSIRKRGMHGSRVTIALESAVALHLGLSLTGIPQSLGKLLQLMALGKGHCVTTNPSFHTTVWKLWVVVL